VKVLVIEMEDAGCGLPFALACIKAGHEVRYFLRKENNQAIGEGFKGLTKVTNWVPSAAGWADLVVATGNDEFVPKLQALRKHGVQVFGPSVASANLEIKREAGMRLLEKCGIAVPAYETFQSLSDAEAHVRQKPERYVFKTLGSEEDKSLSYVGKSAADMVARLQRWQKLKLNPKGPVMLQEFKSGIEIGVSRWMGRDGFVGPYNENFEHKKLLAGDCGPNCGEAGTVMKYMDASALGKKVLDPLEDELVAMGHLGDIDVNCIVDEKDGTPYALEFTCRLGHPASTIMWATHKGDPAQWMLDACEGEDTIEVDYSIACGVVLAQPDYPYSERTQREVADIPIYGPSSGNKKFVHPQSVKMAVLPAMKDNQVVEKRMWATCGDYVAVVTGTGKSVTQACKRAYKVIGEIEIPDMMYRDDIGEKLEAELPKLHAHGFATEFRYA
jgi:phosphoribosylamine---glycine ligase